MTTPTTDDLLVLKRVPENKFPRHMTEAPFKAAIIDLETMGLDCNQHEIIELGLLTFAFDSEKILGLVDTYNALQDPGKPIPEEITKITGIRDADVKGQAIDWDHVSVILSEVHLIICHNSGFDRKFLEHQTPDKIRARIQKIPFGCSLKDVNWTDRGFESAKLDYLNFKLGYFYDGHRALNDCYATYNLFIQLDDLFGELKHQVKTKETLIVCLNAPFEKKDLLKEKKYRWSDGQGTLPKGWWTTLPNHELEEEYTWLDTAIYGYDGAAARLPKAEITAHKRYSNRANMLDCA